MGQHQRAAHQGHHHIHDVAHVAKQRHQDIGKAVAVAGIEKDLSVYFVKIGPGGILVAEHFDNLLACHHLFHKGFRLGQRNLLAQKIFGRVVCDIAGCKGHANYPSHYNQAQNDAVIHHNAEHRQQRHAGDHHLRQALANHLAQGVYVVGVIAHDVAVAVGIKIFDGQVLHMVEHLFAQLFQRALRDDGHHLRIGKTGGQAEEIQNHQKGYQPQNGRGHRGPIARPVGVVHNLNDVLHEDGGNRADNGIEQDAHQCNRQQNRVKLKQQAQKPAQNALGRTLAAGRCGGGGCRLILRHFAHLPCSEWCRSRGRSRCAPSAHHVCQCR